jgi:hypothetical protein
VYLDRIEIGADQAWWWVFSGVPLRVKLRGMGLFFTTFGAVLTTLLGILVGSVLSNRSQTRHWSRDRQADACAQVLRESSNLLIELARLNGQKIVPASDGVSIQTSLDWKPWNEALAMVNLMADRDIAAAAHAIDAQFWPVHQKIKRGWTREGDWYKLRNPVEECRRDSSISPGVTSLRGERLCGALRQGRLKTIRSSSPGVLTSRTAKVSLTSILSNMGLRRLKAASRRLGAPVNNDSRRAQGGRADDERFRGNATDVTAAAEVARNACLFAADEDVSAETACEIPRKARLGAPRLHRR